MTIFDQKRKFSMIREYHLIASDVDLLFGYIEPCDANKDVYSHRLFEILLRSCTACECILKRLWENEGLSLPSGKRYPDMKEYFKINSTYGLHNYKVKIPSWRSGEKEICPFDEWDTRTFHALCWYDSYNKVKHDVQAEFKRASLKNVIDAIAGLFVLLYSQFEEDVFSRYQDTEMTHNDDGWIYSNDSLFSVKKDT